MVYFSTATSRRSRGGTWSIIAPPFIDRPILDLLKIDVETPLEISTDGQRLIVAPAAPPERRAKFDAAQQWAHKRYGKAFKRLAE